MRKSPADPAAPWPVILVTDGVRDPAVSPDAPVEALIEYIHTRDPAMIGAEIPLADGIKPTRWTLAPLSVKFMSETLAREPNADKQRELACRAALVGAEGPDAAAVNYDQRQDGAGGMRLLVDAEYERLFRAIGYGGVLELGDVALQRARLRPGARGPFGLCR